MKRRALRRAAIDRLDVRVADVAASFNQLTSNEKAELIVKAPDLYFAVARMVRMREVALEVSR